MINLTDYIKDTKKKIDTINIKITNNKKDITETKKKLEVLEKESKDLDQTKSDILLSDSIIKYFKNMGIKEIQIKDLTINNERTLISALINYQDKDWTYQFPKDYLRHDLAQHKNDFIKYTKVNGVKYYTILCNKVQYRYAALGVKYGEGYNVKQSSDTSYRLIFDDFKLANEVASGCDKRMTSSFASAIESIDISDISKYKAIKVHARNSSNDLVNAYVLKSVL